MQKVKSNALWNDLSEDQLKTLDKWLFEEKTGYAQAWTLASTELGFKGSVSSVRRYYGRRRDERVTTEFKDLWDDVAAIRNAPGDAASTREAFMKVLGQFLFRRVRECPDKVKELAAVADLMVRNEYNEIIREAKAREHQIREKAMAFAKEKFEFDTMEKALKALPQLKELEEAKKDPHTKRYEENAYWNQVRHAMYGLGIEVQPESAQEEAELAAARKAREERQKRAQEMQANIITNAAPPAPSSPHYEEYMKAQAKWDLENWGMCGEYEI